MADNVKVLIGEKNGSELEYQEEYELIPANIPFSDSGFTATDVKAAILEAAGGDTSVSTTIHAKQLILLDSINGALEKVNRLLELIND